MAYYGPDHRSRLELIRALQEHGFTLAAIERYLAGVPLDATAEELAVQRALLTAWKPSRGEVVTRSDLDVRAGRALEDADIDWLVEAGALRRNGPEEFQALAPVELAVEMLDLDMPLDAIVDATSAVRRHMGQLADELSGILRTNVVSRYRRDDLSMEDAERLERTLANLRALTLDAIVSTFQHAANQVVTKSMTMDARGGHPRKEH
jgi:DNA-binding transcriptional MerR regulator